MNKVLAAIKMGSRTYINIAREMMERNAFYLSHHAQIERGKEKITVDDIISAILNGRELEPYPDDPRGESCLIAGQGLDFRWMHILCGNFEKENLIVITVYIPRLPKWSDPFTRRI